MKFCPNCNTAADDNATFCTACGASFAPAVTNAAPNYAPNGVPNAGMYAPPMVDPTDHTAEFDANDVAENKLFAMLGYLFGFIGIAVALLAKKDSAYVDFHIKQALKICILNGLLALAAGVLVWTFIVPFAVIIATTVLEVISVICFFDVCKGKAKEPAIVCKISFLK